MEDEIRLSKSKVEEILEYLVFDVRDDGPADKGWKSDELIKLIGELEEAVGVPEDKRWSWF